VDLDEAYSVACKAVEIGINVGTGYMATILRRPGKIYEAYFDKVKLEVVANSVRFLPKDWISPSGIDVTDAFIDYAKPLIGDGWPEVPMENGLQRFARLNLSFIEKKLPDYVPCRTR
jgi:6-phosphofructokinase 1